MKKTNRRSRTNPHNSRMKPKLTREVTQKEANNIVNNHHIIMAWCTTSMMHVQFNEAWHGKVHKQSYKLSGAHYATELHIDENTTFKLFSSISFMYPTILNVVKHGKRVKQSKTTYLVKFKWGRKQRTTSPETPHVHILSFGTVLP